MKRLFDFFVSLFTILILLNPMAVIALVVRIKMGSPVVFRQKRPGLNGRPFYIQKFRTMTDEKDSNDNLLSDDIRLTTSGKVIRKLSLDELPQLFNVIKGDMSFVGPRPLLMEYLPLYNKEQSRRHNVRPGITGWAQINGRNAIEWEDKFKLDTWYVDNQSFFLDIRIIFLTVLKVFKSEGVSKDGQVTTDKFTGNKEEKGFNNE